MRTGIEPLALSPLSVLGLILAGALAVAGGTLLWSPRRAAGPKGHPSEGETADDGLGPRRFGLSEPTRLVLGLCLLVLGYHAAAYSLPSHWIALHVPASKWWLLATGVGLAVGGSLAADRFESRSG